MKLKITACILSLILAVSSVFIATSAIADETDVPSDDYNFALHFGIIPKTIAPDSPVKRIELAQCFTNVLLDGVEKDKTSVSKYFSDVNEGLGMYADTVASLGIMSGIGGGMFNPDGYVTKAQLTKAMVSFLGYDEKARTMGEYPGGYMAVASMLDILDSEGAPDSIVTTEHVATMFKLAINAPIMEKAYYSDTYTYIERTNISYLAKYMSIHRHREVVNATYVTNVLNSTELPYNQVIVGETKFTFDPEKFDIGNMIGRRVDVYYKNDNSVNELVFFEEIQGNVIKIGQEDFGGYSGELSYYEGMKERKIRFSKDVNVIYNGTLCESYGKETFTPWKNTNMDGSITAIDNNNDKLFDFILIDAYDTYVVKNIVGDKIFPMYRTGVIVDLGDYVDGQDILFRNINGKPVLLSDISEGDVLSVFKDKNGKLKNIVVTIDTVAGELEYYEKSDGKYYFMVSGVLCQTSNALSLNPQLESVEIGTRISLMLNKDGLVSDIETLKYQSLKLGYVVKTLSGKNTIDDQKVRIRVFTPKGEFEAYTISKRTTVVYGDERNDGVKPTKVLEYLGTTDRGQVVRQPIYYKINENDEMDYLEIHNPDSGPIDGFHKLSTGVEGVSTEFRTNSGLAGKLLVSDTTIFGVPSEEYRDEDEYYMIAKMSGSQKYTIEAAWTKEKGSRIASVLVIGNTQNTGSIYQSATYMVIDKASTVIDADGQTNVKIVGYVQGALQTYYAEDGSMNISPESTLPDAGDIIKFILDAQGKVTDPEFIFDETNRNMPMMPSNPSSTTFLSKPRYVYGDIVWSNKSGVTIGVSDSNSGTYSEEAYLLRSNMLKVQRVNSKTTTVSVADAEDFYMMPAGSVDNRTVFVYTSTGDPQLMVIYD